MGFRGRPERTISVSLIDTVGLAAQDAVAKAVKNSMLYGQSIDGFPAYTQA